MFIKKNKIIEKFIQFNKNYRPPKDFVPPNFVKKIVITNKNNNLYMFSKLFFDNSNLVTKLEAETSTKFFCNEIPLKNISKQTYDYFLNNNEFYLTISGENQEKVYLTIFKVNHAINILRKFTKDDVKNKGLLKLNHTTKKAGYDRNKISNSYLYTTNKNSNLFSKKFGNIIKVLSAKKDKINLKNEKIELNKFINLNHDKLKKAYLTFLELNYNIRYKINLISNVEYVPFIKAKHTLLIWDMGNNVNKNNIIYNFIAFGLIEFNKITKYYDSSRYSILIFHNPYNLKEAKNIMDLKFLFSKRIKTKII